MAVPDGPFRCSNCNKIEDPTSPLQRCGGCRKLRYCSRTCQKAHWKAVHQERCNQPTNHLDKDWPEQEMPARVYPHNTHLNFAPGKLVDSDITGLKTQKPLMMVDAARKDGLLLNKDAPTTYKLLIESFRAWDEAKRYSLGTMVDPRFSYMDASVKYNTGYLFQALLKHITNAENAAGILPSWWDAEKRDACIKLAKEMYHWDDLPDAGVPREVNDWRRYGGPPLRNPLRDLGRTIEGLSLMEATVLGYYKITELPNGTRVLHTMNHP